VYVVHATLLLLSYCRTNARLTWTTAGDSALLCFRSKCPERDRQAEWIGLASYDSPLVPGLWWCWWRCCLPIWMCIRLCGRWVFFGFAAGMQRRVISIRNKIYTKPLFLLGHHNIACWATDPQCCKFCWTLLHISVLFSWWQISTSSDPASHHPWPIILPATNHMTVQRHTCFINYLHTYQRQSLAKSNRMNVTRCAILLSALNQITETTRSICWIWLDV
jgi:hypothetical protein